MYTSQMTFGGLTLGGGSLAAQPAAASSPGSGWRSSQSVHRSERQRGKPAPQADDVDEDPDADREMEDCEYIRPAASRTRSESETFAVVRVATAN